MNMPPGWGQPKSKRILRQQLAQTRKGGRLRRTKRLRKKFEKGCNRWFDLHIKGGGFLP